MDQFSIIMWAIFELTNTEDIEVNDVVEKLFIEKIVYEENGILKYSLKKLSNK